MLEKSEIDMKGLLVEIQTLKVIFMRAQKEKSWKEKFHLFREYINNEKNDGRNIDVKGHSGDVSDGNEEQVTGNWRKGDPCYKVAKNSSELCSSVLWKVELVSDETGYLTEISKQC